MGGNSDHQCIVDPAGGVQPKYIGESEGISFLLDFVFCFFGNCRIIYILLYKCGNRTDDCDHCIGDILCDIFLWQKPLGFCVNEKIRVLGCENASQAILPLQLIIACRGKIA